MGKELLNSTEAAIKLGVTKELLFAYVRNAPKKDESRKLKTIEISGENYFDAEELKEFEAYLREPWSDSTKSRPSIPKYIQEYLKVESGGKCPITGKGYPLENAHIVDYSDSLNHHHHNLIRISRDLHGKFDGKVTEKSRLKEVKERLIAELRSKLQSESIKYNSTFRPPSPHSLFVGRDEQIDDLLSAINDDRFIIIQGIGGIGKTQLLVQALEKTRDDYETIWLDIENVSHLHDLEIKLNQVLQSKNLANPNLSLVDQLDKLKTRIVFDGIEKLQIEDPDKITKFISDLAQYTSSPQFIITTQIDLSTLDLDKTIISLDGISLIDSILVIKATVNGSKFGDEILKDLAVFCEGHPLSLKLLAALLIYYGDVSRVKAHLKNQKAIKHPLRKNPDKSTSLDVCLSSIYNCLSKEQKKLLKYFVCFPGGCKIARVLPNIKSDSFDEDIAVLKQFFLIQIKEDLLGFHRVHLVSPIRKFLKERAQKNIREAIFIQKEAITGLMLEAVIVSFKYLEFNEHEVPEYGLMRLECELPNLKEAFHITHWGVDHGEKYGESPDEYRRIRASIASSLGKYFFVRGFFQYGKTFAEAGIQANLELNDYEGAAQQYMYLAQIQMRQFDFVGYEKTTKNLNRLAEKTKCNEIETKAAWCKGNLELKKRNFDLALNHFHNAQKLLEEELSESFDEYILRASKEWGKRKWTNEDYEKSQKLTKGNLSNIYSEIASAYEFSERFRKAIFYYLKSIRVSRDLGYHTNTPSIFHQLGNCYSSIGKLTKSIDYYHQAIDGFIRFGNFEYLGNSISELGRFSKNDPEIVKHPHLNEDVLNRVLTSLTYQLFEFINRINNEISTKEAIQHLPSELLGKTILTVQFMSFTDYSYLLYDWAIDLNGQLGIQVIAPNYFTSILNVAHIVGGVGYGHHKSEQKNNMLEYLKTGVLILNGGPDLKSKTDIFYWLATWLKFRNLDPEATPEKLLKEAFDSLE